MMTFTRAILSSSVGKKGLMAASGFFLGFFLFVHAIGNATTFFGREAFNAYAHALHSLGYLVPLFEIVLLLVFLVHVGTGLTLFFENLQARPVRYHVRKGSGGRTIGSRTMPYSGAVILLFIVIHLANFHFTDHSVPIADIVRNVLTNPLYTVFYGTAMIVLGLHLSHGFWSLLQTLGINHPRYDASLAGMSLAAALFLSAVFFTISLAALFCKSFLL